MLVITGAAGFIGSCLVSRLNELGRNDLILVDDFSSWEKKKNVQHKKYLAWSHRDAFVSWFASNYQEVEAIFHLGARTDTTEFDVAIFDRLNLNYSKSVWQLATKFNIPLIYASSAATYGLGEFGYVDRHDIVEQLKPLNPYGASKNDFDKWALQQMETPPNWYGMKFFNVYGPNEYHKSRMASVISHAFKQIQATDKVKLFRSHRPDFEDGQQLRDFIYVKDVINICIHLWQKLPESGLYNVGTGKARTFLHLAEATFHALDKTPQIEFIDTPKDIRGNYQYFTQADTTKLLATIYQTPFYTLEEGVKDYVQQYLLKQAYY